jgi:hypothetical protein
VVHVAGRWRIVVPRSFVIYTVHQITLWWLHPGWDGRDT